MLKAQTRLSSVSSRIGWRDVMWEREARTWAGLVLFAFVTMHLVNHALGVLGVPAMEAAQDWRVWLWRTWPGTIALYGAAALHVGLALKRIVFRRACRMPLEEGAQIALGLAIPVLVLEHAIGTRYASSVLGTDDSYRAVLHVLYPAQVAWQTALVLVAWFHGIIGIHYVIRHKTWFARIREIGFAVAFALPLLAIAGFISAGREALVLYPPVPLSPDQIAGLERAVQISDQLLIGAALLLLATMTGVAVARRMRGLVPVRFVGHGEVDLRPGSTLLEASRENGIPHPSLCGGRGRCSTCRVLVLSGQDSLPEPTPAERKVLTRISAPASVRLACQIRPQHPLSVQILLPAITHEVGLDWEEEAYKWGVDRKVTILFVDIRGFTTLSRRQLPADTVLLVNRFLQEITQAVEAHNGRIGMYLSDGAMAIFGLGGQKGMGSRDAIAAGRSMLRVASTIDAELGSALPMPFRIGIGIHCGPAVIARVGDNQRGYMVVPLGETVDIASRLENATKEVLADMLVSDDALQASRVKLPGATAREISMRGRDESIKALAFSEPPNPEAQSRNERPSVPEQAE